MLNKKDISCSLCLFFLIYSIVVIYRDSAPTRKMSDIAESGQVRRFDSKNSFRPGSGSVRNWNFLGWSDPGPEQ